MGVPQGPAMSMPLWPRAPPKWSEMYVTPGSGQMGSKPELPPPLGVGGDTAPLPPSPFPLPFSPPLFSPLEGVSTAAGGAAAWACFLASSSARFWAAMASCTKRSLSASSSSLTCSWFSVAYTCPWMSPRAAWFSS